MMDIFENAADNNLWILIIMNVDCFNNSEPDNIWLEKVLDSQLDLNTHKLLKILQSSTERYKIAQLEAQQFFYNMMHHQQQNM